MAGWGAFFAVAAGPIVKKALTALGVGLITFTGLSAVQGAVNTAVGAAWSGLGADVYSVLALAGFVDAVAYWLSAITAAVAVASMSRLGVVTA